MFRITIIVYGHDLIIILKARIMVQIFCVMFLFKIHGCDICPLLGEVFML